ncbi:hypothetical protein ACFX1T_013186 [Malus domestica]
MEAELDLSFFSWHLTLRSPFLSFKNAAALPTLGTFLQLLSDNPAALLLQPLIRDPDPDRRVLRLLIRQALGTPEVG